MKIEEVSIIRGIALIGVVLVHSPQYFIGINPAINDIVQFGQMGCQLFFLLSAYCLCLSQSKEMSPLKFYKRRITSIDPAYWLTIAINLVLVICFMELIGFSILPKMDVKPLDILFNVLLIHGFVPLPGPMCNVVMGGWYIGNLMILYLLFPFLKKAYFISNPIWRRYRFILFPLVVATISSSITIISGLGNESFCILGSVKYYSFINQLPVFALGFTLYDIVQGEHAVKCIFPKIHSCYSDKHISSVLGVENSKHSMSYYGWNS